MDIFVRCYLKFYLIIEYLNESTVRENIHVAQELKRGEVAH